MSKIKFFSKIKKMLVDFNQLIQLINYSKSSNKISFFYTSPGDNNHYHITCELLEKDLVKNGLLNYKIENINHHFDHTFYYQLEENKYKISCCLISPSLIMQLVVNYTGVTAVVSIEHIQEKFCDKQRENLERHLKESALAKRFHCKKR